MSFKPADLVASVDKKETVGLNISDAFPLSNLWLDDDRLAVRSDADEQVIIHVAFNTAVNIHAIKFSGAFGDESPRVVKLYVNRVSVSFQDVDSFPPTQVLELAKSDFEEASFAQAAWPANGRRARTVLTHVAGRRCAAPPSQVPKGRWSECVSPPLPPPHPAAVPGRVQRCLSSPTRATRS
jgi:hypothetical protein